MKSASKPAEPSASAPHRAGRRPGQNQDGFEEPQWIALAAAGRWWMWPAAGWPRAGNLSPDHPPRPGSNSKETNKCHGKAASAVEAVRSSVGRQPIKYNLMNHDILLFCLRGRMEVCRYAEVSIFSKGVTTVMRQSEFLARQRAESKSDLAHRRGKTAADGRASNLCGAARRAPSDGLRVLFGLSGW